MSRQWRGDRVTGSGGGQGCGRPLRAGPRVSTNEWEGVRSRADESHRSSEQRCGSGPGACRAGSPRSSSVRVAPVVFGQGHPGLVGVAQGLPGLGFSPCLSRVTPVLSGSPWPLCHEVATNTPRGGSAWPVGRFLVQSVPSSSIAWLDGGLSALSGIWPARSFGFAGISSVPSA